MGDSDLEHESEDEFEQYRNEAGPSYAQYMGDSDLEDDDSEDSSEDEEVDHGESGSDAETGSEQDYMEDVHAGALQKHKGPLVCPSADLVHLDPRLAADTPRNADQSAEEAQQALKACEC